jgi:phasin family protein
MPHDMLNHWSIPTQPVWDAVRQLNQLAVTNLERAVNLQLTSLQAQADLLFSNLRVGLEIKDAEGLRDYVGRQSDLAKVMSEKLVNDVHQLTEVGAQFGVEAVKVVQNGMDATAQKAA